MPSPDEVDLKYSLSYIFGGGGGGARIFSGGGGGVTSVGLNFRLAWRTL